MFEQWKVHRAQRQAAKAAQQHAGREAAWEVTDRRLATLVEQVANAAAGSFPPIDVSLPLHRSEHALFALDGVGLIEPRRGPGHWQGGTQGVSVHVPGTRSMRYRIGATQGSLVPGDEKPTLIDTGALTITDRRAVFVGAKQSREWDWAKVVGFHDDEVHRWTGIAVSNRQKISGVSYPADQAAGVRIALELGVALANGTVAELVSALQAERDAWTAQRPALPR